MKAGGLMAYIDATYYRDSFHCTTMPEQFDRLADIASDIIDSIVSKPVQSLDKTSDAYQLVQKACAYIVETLDANGGVDATTGLSDAGVSSVSLGDYSENRNAASEASQAGAVWFGDVRLPNLALTLLRRAGLTSRWAYAGTVIDDGYR